MTRNRILVIAVVALSVVSILMGVTFIVQGITKSTMLVQAMQAEKATYDSDTFKSEGVIDSPVEAASMAAVLREHREAQGFYTELKRDDPKRQTILNAMTMENSLNLAQLGFGLVTVVQATGAFMIVIGVALGLVAVCVRRMDGVTLAGQG